MTDDIPADRRPPDAPVALHAEHWNTKVQEDISELCQRHVTECPSIRSVAHYSNGILDFVVHVHDAEPLRGGLLVDHRIDAEGRPGHQLVRCVQDIDRSLAPLRTGELMRTVVGTPTGALYCGRVKADQHLVGITVDGDGIDAMDGQLNKLVTEMRILMNLPNEYLGGLELPYLVPDGTEGLQFLTGHTVDEPSEARLRGLWHRFVNHTDLQYLAYYRGWELICVGDAFDSPHLGLRFLAIEPDSRRRKYRDIAGGLRTDIARLRDALHSITRDPIDRLVLDVQEGAVYIHWLPGGRSGDFLLGVTLDQHQVGNAERRLREVLNELPPPSPRSRFRR
ncbi:hypothetical protein ABZ348_23845 [Streptomyces sp. NPDC005963]|uniref:hypothetical protein n=1 Tax=Streptomyces sp. NPDC005963 TaxID=3156721 RepID=UPI0033F59DA6